MIGKERLALEELYLDGAICLAPAGTKAARFFKRMNKIVNLEGLQDIEYDSKTGEVKVK